MAVGLEQVREYMEAAIGKLSPAKAQELAKSLTKNQGRDQVSKAAKDLLAWSNKNKERPHLDGADRGQVAAEDDRRRVPRRGGCPGKRVRELERAGQEDHRKRSTAKRTTAKRATAKRATSSPLSEQA